jgi:hypothetical protein
MSWIEVGRRAFDTDDVIAVRRHQVTYEKPVGRVRTVTDVYLSWGPIITLEGDEAAEFLDRWASQPGQSRRAPLGWSYAIHVGIPGVQPPR